MDIKGNIVLVNNLIFTSQTGIKHFDHAYQTGRPTVIVSESDASYYGCILSSSAPEAKYRFALEPDMVYYEFKKYKKPSKAVVSKFFELKVCGYPKIGKIKPKNYLLLLKFILEYYNNLTPSNEQEAKINEFVLEDISKQLTLK